MEARWKLEELTPEALSRATDLPVFERIEELRARMCASDTVIRFRDHGARAPDLELTAEEMYAGLERSKPVRQLASHGNHPRYNRYLHGLVRTLRPETVVELGTCCGFSTLYLALAREQTTVHTIEGAPAVAELAAENFRLAVADNVRQHVGRFEDLLEAVLTDHPPDLVYVDGQHDGDATLGYFHQLCAHLKPGAVIVFDDIRWSEGMLGGWRAIAADPDTESLDLDRIGVVRLRR